MNWCNRILDVLTGSQDAYIRRLEQDIADYQRSNAKLRLLCTEKGIDPKIIGGIEDSKNREIVRLRRLCFDAKVPAWKYIPGAPPPAGNHCNEMWEGRRAREMRECDKERK